MHSVKIRSHVGPDGILKLEVPVGVNNVDIDVIVSIHPLETATRPEHAEARGWPAGFFERFAGSIPDFPDIDSEGVYEERDQLE